MPNAWASRLSCSRHPRHQRGAIVAHHVSERRLAEHAAQRRVEQRREPRVRAFDRADRLVEQQRIDDAIAREGIDDEPLLVGADHFLRRILEIENALVDVDDAVDERPFEVQAGLGDGPHGIAEAHHQRLTGLLHREQRKIGEHDDDDREDGEDAAGDIVVSHRAPPADGVGAGEPVVGRLRNSGSGRYGTTPWPFGAGIHDDLVGAAEQPLHGFEIEALARHVRRLLVFIIDLAEAARPGPWPRRRSARDRLRRPG